MVHWSRDALCGAAEDQEVGCLQICEPGLVLFDFIYSDSALSSYRMCSKLKPALFHVTGSNRNTSVELEPDDVNVVLVWILKK